MFSRILFEELHKYDMAIIYGFADIGTCLLDYVIDIETSIRIANYSGKVKYFATSSKVRKSLRSEIKGIKIKYIGDLDDYKNKALIIVATQEKHHRDISKTLDEFGFENRLYVKHADYCEIREKIENHKGIINARIGQYHINHQIKLDRLRRKIEKGKKAKVFFMTHDSAVFGAASVYRSMEQNPIFEPYIYVISRRDVTYENFMEDVRRDVNFFSENKYEVICGYDEYGNPVDIHQYNPDILFFDLPKLHGSGSSFYNRLDYLNWEYLTCYIPYGMYMMDSFYYHYHLDAIRETWKYFVDTQSDYKRVLKDGDFNGFNMIMSGYPKYDDYYSEDIKVPEKVNNDKPLVIYAPHHSLGGVSNNLATFDLYGSLILDFVKQNPNINFVFKPHPLLYFQILYRYNEGKISISPSDYENYLKEWSDQPNAIVVSEGNYIGLFRKSTCMITDCGSFIGEYFPSLNPCIYIFNPRKKQQMECYTPLAREILGTYYIAESRESLEKLFQEVIIQKNDIKLEKRKCLFDEEFNNIGNAGQYICDYLERELMA